ncbi:MAG: B12-binding domain-containing radical SAM protein [Polyangiaceae bacterium]|nr:B12-binding domain-containing radical SAM protein [Polyangiaceae bacterium]
MRVALLYPPPWKLEAPGGPSVPPGSGPPDGWSEGDLDADFHQVPYGLLSLAAQAERAGHSVVVLNLSASQWPEVERILGSLVADVVGLSCWTANRRGVGYVAQAVKAARADTHVVVGGPHASPLARELLAHHPAIDTVCIGESEETFLELLARLERGEGHAGIAGTAYRDVGVPVLAPERPSIADLDTLASPHDRFATHIVMTSRGCPWQCTFCGAETTWGRGFRGRSVPRVLDDLAAALERVPVRVLLVKDDTFTANRRRALAICQGIRERGLRFAWSCDTRVDVLTEELVREMRLAGCERLSLGVESGAESILRNIDKRISVAQIEDAAALARRYGLRTRFYMMLGNRGETRETFRESLAFLERARPSQYVFSCLSVYPGTLDAEAAEAAGWLDREVWFQGSFQELKVPFDAPPELTRELDEWFAAHKGVRTMHRPGAAECGEVLARLGDHPPAHLDLAVACFREGELARARGHAGRALELGHPLPGLVFNTLACVALAEGDVEGMQAWLLRAARKDPQHAILIRNVNAARAWFARRGPERSEPLELDAELDFQLLERTLQPTLPGPVSAGLLEWPPAGPGRSASGPMRLPLAPHAAPKPC